MTCCRLKHKGGTPCDRESLVPTMMSMYFDLYAKNAAGMLPQKSTAAWELVSKCREKMFPQKFNYVTEKGQPAQKKLFGGMIGRAERLVQKDVQYAMGLTSTDTSRSSLDAHGLVPSTFDANVEMGVEVETPFQKFRSSVSSLPARRRIYDL